MQNKGVIKLLAILLALFSIYQLSFTYVTKSIESDAKIQASEFVENDSVTQDLVKDMAKGDQNLAAYLLDSIKAVREKNYLDTVDTKYMWQDYRQCKEQELNLGLDLKGGMNVIMEVSVADIITALAGNNGEDSLFINAINNSQKAYNKSNGDFVQIFTDEYKKLAGNDAKLASLFSSVNGVTIGVSTDQQVVDILNKEVNDAIESSYKILRTRIDRFGVAQPNIQELGSTGRILIELPGIKDPERVRNLLKGTAKLEFWETYRLTHLTSDPKDIDFANYINLANQELSRLENTDELEELSFEGMSFEDSIAAVENRRLEEQYRQYPLFRYLQPNSGVTACVGRAKETDKADVDKLLDKVKYVFPQDLKFAWSAKPITFENSNVKYYELIALRGRDNKPECAMSGDVISDARQDYDNTGNVIVSMEMFKNDGDIEWGIITSQNIDKQIAIVLDDQVYSYPNVNDKISGGRSQISGNFSIDEAKDLANILKAGKLPAPARIIEENVVGPSLGQEAITSGLWSFIIAFCLVLIYMMFFYSKAGIAADIALLVNILFFFGVVTSFGTVLTLPGIAGIVLTLGMAVDSNVIIFERIKEEIAAGKGIRLAVADGFKAAYSAILDGQITTFLTGFILFEFGTGPVRGFATTLMIGICTSLFTSIFITRLIIEGWLNKNKDVKFSTKMTQNFLKHTKFDFIKFGKKAFVIGGIAIVVCLGSIAFRGLNLGIDFAGGRNYVVRFDNDKVTDNDVRAALATIPEFKDQAPIVKTYGASRQFKITTKYKIDIENEDVDQEINQLLYNGLKDLYETPLSEDQFKTDSENSNALLGILSSQKVNAKIANEVANKAIWAVLISLVVIFGYIAFRFKKWQYGVSSIIALAHDTIIVIGMYSLLYNVLPFAMEVDQPFIAAVLTIIGYSINNTVVIFDRIRENVTLYPKRSWYERINDGVNSTLLRSINTSGSTLIVLLAIFIFGGETIQGFVFALLVGIVAGTFSSLFIASPMAYILFKGKQTDAKMIEAADKKRK